MEVFVPISERLGLDIIKSEIEDICISYLEPEKYQEIKKLLSKKAKILQKSLDGLKKRIADVLFQKEIPFEISSRVKSINSIYRKMYVKGHAFVRIRCGRSKTVFFMVTSSNERGLSFGSASSIMRA